MTNTDLRTFIGMAATSEDTAGVIASTMALARKGVIASPDNIAIPQEGTPFFYDWTTDTLIRRSNGNIYVQDGLGLERWVVNGHSVTGPSTGSGSASVDAVIANLGTMGFSYSRPGPDCLAVYSRN
ncbi:MAG: hypothetical protein AABX32_06130 [Nanoarchaeota archaeon]